MCQSAAHNAPHTPPAHTCGCGSHGASASPEVGRRVPASHEMNMPEVPFPSPRVLAVAGAEGLRRLVRHHHGLLRQSAIAHLFAADDDEFAALVERIADYVVETCGGPALFSPLNGNTCIRTRHFPFTIDERGREIWLEKLYQAIEETGFPQELRAEYWAWMEPFSVRMINRRTTKTQPVHLPYALARARFAGLPLA